MKVCLHTNWDISPKYIGGTERFLINLCKELQTMGLEPFIVCSSKTDQIQIEGIQVIGRFLSDYNESKTIYPYFSSNFIKQEIIGKEYSLESLHRLSEYTSEQLKGIQADVFHLNSFISASFLKPMNNYVITNHENDREYDWYWGKGFFEFLKYHVVRGETNLHKFSHLFVPSTHYAKWFSVQFGLNVQSINLGVPLNEFIVSNKDVALRNEYSFNQNEVIILLPSRFQPYQKGHDIALAACAILKKKGISFKIIFTGVKNSSEKYLSDFDALVLKYNLQNNVKVVTFSDMNEAYNNVDIVISPERFCSYGLSISESLSLGIPTILSDIPTYKEIAQDSENAFFFKSESYEDLADQLISVISTNCIRKRIDALKFRINNDIRTCAKSYIKTYLDINSAQSK